MIKSKISRSLTKKILIKLLMLKITFKLAQEVLKLGVHMILIVKQK